MIYKTFLKRPLDTFLSAAAIVLLSPVMGITAIVVRKKLGSPVIFKQERPGKDARVFTLFKFRTMTDERDEKGTLLPDALRLTAFGKWLRATSLDEMPELFNILKGEMSVVGPRPLLLQYLPLYNEKQKRRHEIRPGLTGLAQVSGRNGISWEEKFELDLDYVTHLNFILDMKIILLTFLKVLKREDINQEGELTMEAFKGNKKKSQVLN